MFAVACSTSGPSDEQPHSGGQGLGGAAVDLQVGAGVVRGRSPVDDRERSTRGQGLVRQPGSSLAIIAILALGIGANTAIFSVVNAVLVRPLPLGDPGKLVSGRGAP